MKKAIVGLVVLFAGCVDTGAGAEPAGFAGGGGANDRIEGVDITGDGVPEIPDIGCGHSPVDFFRGGGVGIDLNCDGLFDQLQGADIQCIVDLSRNRYPQSADEVDEFLAELDECLQR